MKTLALIVVALAFLFTAIASEAAASTDASLAGSGQHATVLIAHNSSTPLSTLPSLTTYLVASLALTKEDNNGKAKGHDKDWKNDKPGDKGGKQTYHGAEMSPAAALIAGTLAIGGYLFLLNRRRAARQRA